MVPTDLAFLNVERYELTLRIKFLTSFLAVFDGDSFAERDEIIQARKYLTDA